MGECYVRFQALLIFARVFYKSNPILDMPCENPPDHIGSGRDPISQIGKAPMENKSDAVISSAEELPALSKLRALPLLAQLSNYPAGK
jgi:hypothetical protein